MFPKHLKAKNDANVAYFRFCTFFLHFLLINVDAFSKSAINEFEISVFDTDINKKFGVKVALFANFESKNRKIVHFQTFRKK
jgi:hypothetical protein